MSAGLGKEVVVTIYGVTTDGRIFRPSDWADRLAGAIAGVVAQSERLYSRPSSAFLPCCAPGLSDGARCILANQRLRELDIRAWEFLLTFARENELITVMQEI